MKNLILNVSPRAKGRHFCPIYLLSLNICTILSKASEISFIFGWEVIRIREIYSDIPSPFTSADFIIYFFCCSYPLNHLRKSLERWACWPPSVLHKYRRISGFWRKNSSIIQITVWAIFTSPGDFWWDKLVRLNQYDLYSKLSSSSNETEYSIPLSVVNIYSLPLIHIG